MVVNALLAMRRIVAALVPAVEVLDDGREVDGRGPPGQIVTAQPIVALAPPA
jgi:hypothetical protein